MTREEHELEMFRLAMAIMHKAGLEKVTIDDDMMVSPPGEVTAYRQFDPPALVLKYRPRAEVVDAEVVGPLAIGAGA